MGWYTELTLVQKGLTWLFFCLTTPVMLGALYAIFVEIPARHRKIMADIEKIAKEHKELP